MGNVNSTVFFNVNFYGQFHLYNNQKSSGKGQPEEAMCRRQHNGAFHSGTANVT